MNYIFTNPNVVWGLLLEHLRMTVFALLAATAIALPLGVALTRFSRWSGVVVMLLNGLYTIPSLALMILLIPWCGLNSNSVIVALVIYTTSILVRNVMVGIETINPSIREAARGMGMNEWQLWWRIEFPLSLPTVIAGLRVAALAAIGMATIGAKFSAGGLGKLLFDGITQTGRYDKIWAGAIAVGGLALTVNGVLILVERRFRRI